MTLRDWAKKHLDLRDFLESFEGCWLHQYDFGGSGQKIDWVLENS